MVRGASAFVIAIVEIDSSKKGAKRLGAICAEKGGRKLKKEGDSPPLSSRAGVHGFLGRYEFVGVGESRKYKSIKSKITPTTCTWP